MGKATTVYLDPKLLRAMKLKSIEAQKSVSKLVSEALCLFLREDAFDLAAIRARKREPSRSLEAALKDLERDGLL